MDSDSVLGLFGDNPDIRKLLEQMQPSEEDRKRARRDSLMTFGFSLLANPRKGQEFQSIGNAGLNAMQAQRASMDSSGRERSRNLLGVGQAYDIANKGQQFKDAQLAREQQLEFARQFGGRRGGGPPPLAPPPIGPIGPSPDMPPPEAGPEQLAGPPPEMPPDAMPPPGPPPAPPAPGPRMPQIQLPPVPSTGVPTGTPAFPSLPQPVAGGLPPRRERIERYVAQGDYWSALGREEKAKSFYEQADKLAKIKEQKVLTRGGKRVVVNVYEDGTPEIVEGLDPDKEKAVQINTGRNILAGDPFDLQPVPGGANFPVEMSPSEAANLKLAQSRDARDAAKDARDAAKDAAERSAGQVITDTHGNVYIVDKKSGTGRAVTDTGTGLPLSKGEKPLTEGQANATAYGMRMQSSHDIVNQLEEKGLNLSSPKNLLAHNAATNLVASSSAQQLYAAKLNFMTANLRKESGATISPTEFESEDKKYFPQPGDSALVKKQKAKARELAIKSVGIEAGPGQKHITAERAPTAEEIAAERERRKRGQ